MWHVVNNLKFDVIRHGRVILPAGTTGVEICFRSAKWTYVNDDGQIVHGNLYKYNGKIY